MWLNAYLVYMLPQSLVVTSIITALFTRMSEKAAAGDSAGVREDLSLGLRSAGVFTVLATAGICVLAVPALQLFTPSITLPEAQASAPMLIALALGLGAVIGLVLAGRVAMTGMPQLIAVLNGLVGLAAVLVGYSFYV